MVSIGATCECNVPRISSRRRRCNRHDDDDDDVTPVRSRSRVGAVRWCGQRVSDDFPRPTDVLCSRRRLLYIVSVIISSNESRRGRGASRVQPHRSNVNVPSTSTSSVVRRPAYPRHIHVAYPVHARTSPTP